MKTKLLTSAVAAIALMGGANASAATLIIDDFLTPGGTSDLASSPGSTTGPETNIDTMANPRDFETRQVTVTANGGFVSNAGATVGISDSFASFSSDSGVSFDADVVYSSSDPVNLLLDGINERFQIDLVAGDGTGTFSFTVTDEDGESATVSQTAGAGDLGLTEFFFSSLVQDDDDGIDVDLTRITQLVFSVSSGDDTGLDFTIDLLGITTDSLAEVPLPAGAPLMIAGLAGIAAFRRKRAA
ncbi:VPLPA-CTERM sorting domain-containing protein [Parvularcula maris]|uniref:VPLPA-CTERM sorting domain-containing protein n=1 Tax=Parvularcula maris TaxID=2965077 RepID=A0A9X2RIL0_9PROT|nr:VPLPA-CTERM sorting domain-containing protein [Parvularcula maris]MCQ8186180.1 VPLPA-CTERM sorting domain-containing protein [Parvularcula maris]